MSLLYNSSANKLSKVLICFYQRFVSSVLWFTSWDLLWHKLDGSNIFSPSKLIWAQAPLRIYELCFQTWLQAFWRMTALPLIYNRLKIVVCLHFSDTTFFCISLASRWWCSVCPVPISKWKKKLLPFLTGWWSEELQRYTFFLPSSMFPSSEDQIHQQMSSSREYSCILWFL